MVKSWPIQQQCCGWDQIDFHDDAWPRRERNSSRLVVGYSATMFTRMHEYQGVVVAVGNNAVRHM